jgi:hypothetical protein
MSVLIDGNSLGTFLRERLEEAISQADSTHDGGIARASLDDLTDTICSIYGVERLELRLKELAQLPAEPLKVGFLDPTGKMTTQRELMVTWRLPYTGLRDLWRMSPNDRDLTSAKEFLGPVKVGGLDHLSISVLATGRKDPQIHHDRDQIIDVLRTMVGWVNEQVDAWNEKLRQRVREQLLQRVELAEQGQALDAASDVPIFRAPATEQVPIPVERKSLRPNQTNAADAGGNIDPVMAQGIYDDVVQTIAQMTVAMERSPTASKLDEEDIRNLILFVLNANYRGAAAGEVFNGKGKTDILLRWDGGNAFIGECKFWDGPEKFRKAIKQMLGYMTWRDTKAALIVFMRGGNPTEIVEKAKKELRGYETFVSEAIGGTSNRGDFILHAETDKQRLISVALIGVVIPITVD